MSVSTRTKEYGEHESFLSRSFLDVEKIDDKCYRSKDLMSWDAVYDQRGTYGGQIIGQAMMAASKSVPPHQHLHSCHSYFLHPGKPDRPILYHVEHMRDGRTYSLRNIKATQDERVIFTMELSFKASEDSSLSYHLPMLNAPSIKELPEIKEALIDMKEQGKISESQFKLDHSWYDSLPIEIKHCSADNFLFEHPKEPKIAVWFRAKGHISEDESHNIHKCAVGYMCDIFLLHTSLLPLAPLNDKKYFTVSLDHCMWFHGNCPADEWMLFEVTTQSISDGRAFCHGLIWDQRGKLLVTITQEGVFRVLSNI